MNESVGQTAQALTSEHGMAHLVAELVANLERDREQSEATLLAPEAPLGEILRTLVEQVEQVAP